MNELTDLQKDLIIDMVKADFECGHSCDPWERSFVEVLEDDDDLRDNIPEAQQFYQDCVGMGPAGFYEEYSYLDWDEDFINEYGSLSESAKYRMKNIKECNCGKCPDCGAILDGDRYCAECGFAGEPADKVVTLDEALANVSSKYDNLMESVCEDTPEEEPEEEPKAIKETTVRKTFDSHLFRENTRADFALNTRTMISQLEANGMDKEADDFRNLLEDAKAVSNYLYVSAEPSLLKNGDAFDAANLFVTAIDSNFKCIDLVFNFIQPWYHDVVFIIADVIANKIDERCSLLKWKAYNKDIYGFSAPMKVDDIKQTIVNYGIKDTKMCHDILNEILMSRN